jgi:uncharacterized protein (DUF2235 family)
LKRIIICCDGTWNVLEPTNGSAPTNVAKFYRALAPFGADGLEQRAFYLPGVGTAGAWDWWVGGHTGIGLADKVLRAYRFLVENWCDGDEVYLIGFSRGSFTVRCLVAFIGIVGLLSAADLPAAWDQFERQQLGPTGATLPINMIGAWDTVDALGLPVPGLRSLTSPRLRLHDACLAAHVANAFHAVAIDEIRSAFQPRLWTNDPGPGQRIEQVWFSGVHADCGGGYPEAGLADLSLNWMIRRAVECGLTFDLAYEKSEIHADPLQPLHRERKWLHLLLPRHYRPLLSANPGTERIHWSAVDRINDPTANYHPENLRRALVANGPNVVTDPSEDQAD